MLSKIPYTIGTSVLISPCPRDNTCDSPVTLGLLLDVVGVLSVFDCFQIMWMYCNTRIAFRCCGCIVTLGLFSDVVGEL